jgi:RNA polymerase sigma factor (TIGR02999 family)
MACGDTRPEHGAGRRRAVMSVAPESPAPDASVLLAELRAGDSSAVGRLFPLVYDELKRIARIQRHTWREAETLNTTALVHEAYVKLARGHEGDWRDRAHFLAVAATAMRSILIDHARTRARAKRGGGRAPLELAAIDGLLHAAPAEGAEEVEVLLALDGALDRLATHSDRQGRIVECRFYGGMSVEETAEALGISPATVKRGWAMARAWLYRELSEGAAP